VRASTSKKEDSGKEASQKEASQKDASWKDASWKEASVRDSERDSKGKGVVALFEWPGFFAEDKQSIAAFFKCIHLV